MHDYAGSFFLYRRKAECIHSELASLVFAAQESLRPAPSSPAPSDDSSPSHQHGNTVHSALNRDVQCLIASLHRRRRRGSTIEAEGEQCSADAAPVHSPSRAQRIESDQTESSKGDDVPPAAARRVASGTSETGRAFGVSPKRWECRRCAPPMSQRSWYYCSRRVLRFPSSPLRVPGRGC
ncbi:hypothetical protein B0H12DRAFT_1161607 [Mycena haematopus]|nr:hypothetical protein B0H12DRAFT_1161607 [Mycena haematopus]